jgi:hypothetical protein
MSSPSGCQAAQPGSRACMPLSITDGAVASLM